MDATPGGRDESRVPAAKRRNAQVEVAERVQLLTATTTSTLYAYIAQVCSSVRLLGCMHARGTAASQFPCTQGLFERHKLIVATQLCVAVLRRAGRLQQAKFDFLIRGARATTQLNPLKDVLSDTAWAAVQGLKVALALVTPAQLLHAIGF